VGGSEDEVVLEVLGGSAEDEGGGFEEAVVVLDEDVSDLERSSFMPTALQRLLAKASASARSIGSQTAATVFWSVLTKDADEQMQL